VRTTTPVPGRQPTTLSPKAGPRHAAHISPVPVGRRSVSSCRSPLFPRRFRPEARPARPRLVLAGRSGPHCELEMALGPIPRVVRTTTVPSSRRSCCEVQPYEGSEP
jgi:hypothetical protein